MVIGNPPFLGDRYHRSVLGDDYTETLRGAYSGRVPGRADLVVYWARKAAEKVVTGSILKFGLVATKSIARGASRSVMDFLASCGNLVFDAWTNEPWIVEGAAVRVSLLCVRTANEPAQAHPQLNGKPVLRINPDLTSGIDVTIAKRLPENANLAYQGVKLTGPFDLKGEEARQLLVEPLNPNGRPNSDVIARLYDIDNVLGRESDRWVVDFGCELSAAAAALYEEPFRVVIQRVVPFRNDPERCRSTERRLKVRFWEFQRPRPEMRRALAGKPRYIVTPESSEYRIFVFAPARILIQGSIFCICRDDDFTLGLLSSRIHEIWSTPKETGWGWAINVATMLE